MYFNSEIEVYFRISQDSPMDAKISMIISDICVKKSVHHHRWQYGT